MTLEVSKNLTSFQMENYRVIRLFFSMIFNFVQEHSFSDCHAVSIVSQKISFYQYGSFSNWEILLTTVYSFTCIFLYTF